MDQPLDLTADRRIVWPDLAVGPADPLEMVGLGEDNLGEAVAVRDDVEPHCAAHQMEQVDHRVELPFDRVERGTCPGEGGIEQGLIDFPGDRAVQTADHARLEERQDVDRTLDGGHGQRVRDHAPRPADRPHVDPDHVRTTEPGGVGGRADRRRCVGVGHGPIPLPGLSRHQGLVDRASEAGREELEDRLWTHREGLVRT